MPKECRVKDRRCQARIKNHVSTKGKLGVEKEQNGLLLAKEVRRDVTLLGRKSCTSRWIS